MSSVGLLVKAGSLGYAASGARLCECEPIVRVEPYPYDLGSFRRESSTASAEAQAWFDRGLIWSYAFNHEEAIICFERALDADPGFALAYWGLAYAAGPNYNKQWDAFDEADLRTSLRRAHDAARRAADLAGAAPDGRARPHPGTEQPLPPRRARKGHGRLARGLRAGDARGRRSAP